jgi:hypothetical protein
MRSRYQIVIFLIVCLFHIPAAQTQSIRYVATDGIDTVNDCLDPDNPCATITHAIGEAGNGDAINIAEGIYTERLTIDTELSLHGADEETTIIQAHEQPGLADGRVITIAGEADVEILNVTIRHGNATGISFTDRIGGGIYNESDELILIGVTISSNTADGSGGGMFNNNSSPILTDVTFTDNSAGDGGGLLNNFSSPVLNDVTFSGNTASSWGGGIFNSVSSPSLKDVVFDGNSAVMGGGMTNHIDSFPTLRDVTFNDNTSTGAGGGVANLEDASPDLTNVIFTGNTAATAGGGMYTANNSSVILIGALFTGNSANDSGGAMHTANNSSATITNATFRENIAANGGGMSNDNASASLTDVEFIMNEAGNLGGGMYNVDSAPTLTDVTISNNSAEGGGGGLFNESSSPVLTDVAIINNTAKVAGGGVANNEGSFPSLTNVTIRGNSVEGFGGGLANVVNCSPRLINCVISGNTADDGGGMFNFDDSSPILANVTISGNVAADNGGGIYNDFGSSPTLNNVIIWNNMTEGSSTTASSSIFNSGSDPFIFHSLIANSGGSGGDWEESVGTDGGNNIDADPLFIDSPDPGDAPTGAGNVRLRPGSPAVNAGTNIPYEHEGIAEDITADLDGNSRIRHETVDIGAYEWGWEGDSIVYVNDSASGENDGMDWQNAYTDLQSALWTISVVSTSAADQIWVAAGTYVPANDPDDRDASFHLINGVSMYGGFTGNEETPDERNWTVHESILSGDINNTEEPEGNSYTVVTISGMDKSTVLDGFVIAGGNANENVGPVSRRSGGGIYIDNASPTLTNLIISGNTAIEGGGITSVESFPVLNNVTFIGNATSSSGGGMVNANSSSVLSNVSFIGNSADIYGGGIINHNSSLTLINVTLSGNSADSEGGGMFNSTDLNFVNGIIPTLTNVIIWNNQADGSTLTPSASIFNAEPGLTPFISHSLIANSGGSGDDWNDALGEDLGNNIDIDPLFADEPDPADAPALSGNVRVLTGSPAINAGTNEPFEPGGAAEGISTDFDGDPRIRYGIVDMGVHEWNWSGGSTIFVKTDADGSDDGSDWDNAHTRVYDALKTADIVNTEDLEINQIWVAEGTYTPTDDPHDREASFRPLNGVSILGGFAGTEENADERDWVQNKTILSGDINSSGNLAGNSYNVVVGNELDETAVIDGFTITGGNADGDTISTGLGGGMFNENSSPTLRNVNMSGNSARACGGMINIAGSSPTLINVSITGNSTADGGGGGMGNVDNSDPTLINVTISGNTADTDGGGMLNSQSSPTLINTIIWNNQAGGGTTSASASISNDAFSEPSISYSLIANSGGSGGEWDSALGIDGGNNSDGNPVFLQAVAPSSAPTTDGDYRFESASDAIDAGTNDAVTLLTDLDGSSRIVGGLVDLGAYEFQSADVSAARAITLNDTQFEFNGTYITVRMIGTVAGDPPLLFVDYNNTEPENLLFADPPPDVHGGSHWVIAHAGGPFGVATLSFNDVSELTGAVDAGSISIFHRGEVGEGAFLFLDSILDSDDVSTEVTSFGEFILGWEDDPVSVHSGDAAGIPQEFRLHQNYPNPFNPSTVIHFDVPVRSHVILEVYNILGQRVAVLVDEFRDAGYYSVPFDAGQVPSGVYLYRLQTGSHNDVKKMTLLR